MEYRVINFTDKIIAIILYWMTSIENQVNNSKKNHILHLNLYFNPHDVNNPAISMIC